MRNCDADRDWTPTNGRHTRAQTTPNASKRLNVLLGPSNSPDRRVFTGVQPSEMKRSPRSIVHPPMAFTLLARRIVLLNSELPVAAGGEFCVIAPESRR